MCRLCYFTSASINRKCDFVKELSSSYRSACLTCSFSDKELGEYFQHKKRKAGLLPLKYAVSHVGRQKDGTWVLGENMSISAQGEKVSMEASQFVWIGDIYQGVGVVAGTCQCAIHVPLTTDPLIELLTLLRESAQHNFISSVLTIAGRYKFLVLNMQIIMIQ